MCVRPAESLATAVLFYSLSIGPFGGHRLPCQPKKVIGYLQGGILF